MHRSVCYRVLSLTQVCAKTIVPFCFILTLYKTIYVKYSGTLLPRIITFLRFLYWLKVISVTTFYFLYNIKSCEYIQQHVVNFVIVCSSKNMFKVFAVIQSTSIHLGTLCKSS